MTEHLSKPRLERLTVRALSPSELVLSAKHLANCQYCQRSYQAMREVQRGGSEVRFTLAPEVWLRHEHLEYDQLVALADKTMDGEDQELADLHLKICARCQEDVRSFLAFREEIAPEMLISYTPAIKPAVKEFAWFGWWRGLGWQFRYAVMAAVIAIAAMTSLIVFKFQLNRSGSGRDVTVNAGPSVSDHSASPSPSRESPSEVHSTIANAPSPEVAKGVVKPATATNPAITIRDARDVLIAYQAGSISGLNNIPAETRREVAAALQAGSIPRSDGLKGLEEGSSSLRGRPNGDLFRLLSPARVVIEDDRPLFKWEPLVNARSYVVYVTNAKGKIVAKSAALEPSINQWQVSESLKRGELYSWSAVASLDGREVVSPNSSSSEIKFKILSENELAQYQHLKQTGSHLALGIFCARVGLVSEARKELAELLRLNPKSKLVKKLLRSVH